MSVQPEPVKGVVPMVASVVQPVQQVMVQIPKSTTPSTQTGLVALTLPTGVYDLTEIAQQIG